MRALGLGIVVIALVAGSALSDTTSGVAIWLEMRAALGSANLRVALLERQNDSLRSEIELFETEPATLDRAIREELDLALPGETVVYFGRAGTDRSNRVTRARDERSGILSVGVRRADRGMTQ